MQISRPAASGANRDLAGQMRFGTGREGGNLFMPDMNPRDLGLPAKRVGQAVQAVADDTIDPLDARLSQNLRELIRYSFRHVCFSVEQMLTSHGAFDFADREDFIIAFS
jgi:hypothetical protein